MPCLVQLLNLQPVKVFNSYLGFGSLVTVGLGVPGVAKISVCRHRVHKTGALPMTIVYQALVLMTRF